MEKDKKVIIKWIDSRQIHGWVLDGEIDDTCCSIISCGFLVKETDETYTVALSKGYNPLQWCGINVIPKCCVVSIKEVNNNNKLNIMNKEELERLAKPLNEWLQKNGHPHMQIIISFDGAEVVEGKLGVPFEILD